MNNIYEILEKCLLEIEQGADIDTVLFRYPDYADELRPILETSIQAKEMAVPEPPSYVVQMNRAKVLQHAAQMREAKVKPTSRIWFASLRRFAVTIAVVLALFISGNGLVHAASSTLPGDSLYPVKRTWEDVLLLFTFNTQQRETLEIEHENERLEEINELFAEGRSVKVDFAGYVTRQSGTEWHVSAISILISPQTILPNSPVAIGDAVRIIGVTQNDKTVQAERIELLPRGSKLPEIEDTESISENENEQHEEIQTPQVEDELGTGGESEAPQPNETPRPEATSTPKVESSPEKQSFEGILEAMDEKNGVWTISGRRISIGSAEIKGTPVIGAKVNVEGYQDTNGAFIATKIEIENSSDGGNVTGQSNDNNDNSSEEDNSNDHDNSNNTNDDDHGGNNNNTSGGDD
ncbi:MAG: DUF5667 domain-containing protein [Anaerolineales bacterium]